MNRNQDIKILLMIIATILLAVAGCSDDEDPVRVQDDPPPGPATPQELALQFVKIYGARDIDNYLAILDPDFLMLLSPSTVSEFPDVGDSLVFSLEERIHRRMFSGEDVIDPNEELVPGVQGIDIHGFMALANWEPTDDEDHFPGTVWAPYQVQIIFDHGQYYATMRVEGTVKIYARAHQVSVNGTDTTYYLLAGMKDLTLGAKGTEVFCWGSVKALYR